MAEYPRISIVVPSYNQGQYIGETLQSLIDQQYPNLEIIVIDGGSSDNSPDVIRSYEKHLKYWISEKDSGQTNAINKGLQQVTGELFNWLNSDDLLEPGALFHLADLVKNYKNKNLFIGKTRFFNDNGTIRNSGPVVFAQPEITLGFGQVNQPAMFYRTETIKSFLPLNESLQMCMDLDLWMKYLIKYKHDFLHETDFILAAFRLHDASKTMSGEQPFEKEKNNLYQKLFQLSPNDAFINKSMSYFYLWNADEKALLNDFTASASNLKKVKFFYLTFSEKKRYLSVKKRIIQHSIKSK
ncbi:MAG: glycosyltransferase family 2 protein [Bacteroidia bacterium]